MLTGRGSTLHLPYSQSRRAPHPVLKASSRTASILINKGSRHHTRMALEGTLWLTDITRSLSLGHIFLGRVLGLDKGLLQAAG